ncbi:hypothetical protein [Burkholderia pseudomultivorans]|uniref:hypothetical protein n=1 Tax=Burkholderia pseudomultivorans TaxID=1207504 RepID=UPI000AD7890B|nr:hypothetical protein [Burkholderia pseudomultivorans]
MDLFAIVMAQHRSEQSGSFRPKAQRKASVFERFPGVVLPDESAASGPVTALSTVENRIRR